MTQPPQSLHLLLQSTSCWFWRWCQPRAAGGSGVRLPSAGGEPGAQRLPASCRGDGAGALPGAFAPGCQPHPGQVQCPRGLLQAPLSECPAQPETAMRKLWGSISVSLSVVSELAGRVQGTHWNCVCTFEACDRSLFWRISMKRHEKPILLLIWLKQVGHREGDARSSWQRWLRIVLPPCTVAAEWEQGQTWVPRAQGAGERWGGRAGPFLRQWRYSLLSGRCAVFLPAPGSAFIPGGRAGGTSWAAGRGLLGLGVRLVWTPCLEPPRHRG